MTKKLVWAFAVCLFLLAVAAYAQGPTEFSSNISMKNEGVSTSGKFYFGMRKTRIETTAEGHEMVIITDMTLKKNYILMPQEQMYMENDLGRRSGRRFRQPQVSAVDPSSPCANEVGTTCKKIGADSVGGRACDLWEFDKDGKKDATVCVDQQMKIGIRRVDVDGSSYELTDIKQGPQPENLFKIPDGYQKMSIPGMMGPPTGAGRQFPN